MYKRQVESEVVGREEKEGRRGGSLTIHTLENRYLDADGEAVVVERWKLIETAKTVEA